MNQPFKILEETVMTVTKCCVYYKMKHVIDYYSRDNSRDSTHSRFYCQQSYRIMINPYNQKIKSVNIIWTCCFFVFIIFFF